jgi:hypothetical protein
MPDLPQSSRWDLSNWTSGPVTLFQALGIKTGSIQYPQLNAPLATAAAGAGSATSTSPAAPSAASSKALGKTEASNKALGQQLAASYGWGSGDQWTALNNVVMAESGWNNTVTNPSSGAYGIAQALPATKYPQAGQPASDGGASNAQVQILWMLAYIKARYGTPVAAWNHEQAVSWY